MTTDNYGYQWDRCTYCDAEIWRIDGKWADTRGEYLCYTSPSARTHTPHDRSLRTKYDDEIDAE